MKQLQVMKTGDLRSKDPAQRPVLEVVDTKVKPLARDAESSPLAPNEVRIKVAYCAICGSDPHTIGGFFGWPTPFSIGHEISGVIVEMGSAAGRSGKGLKVGDRVAGNFLGHCGECYYCQNGQEQFCPHAEEYNSPGFSQYIIWTEGQVYKLPDDVTLKQGCLLEPTAIICRAMDKINMQYGSRVAICGGGPIGLLALQAVKIQGGLKVTLIEPIEQRRELAKKFGADYVIDPVKQNLKEEADKITDGKGYDIVIDFSGSKYAVEPLPSIVAKCGYLLYGAQYPNDYCMPLNLTQALYHNEITMSGMFVAPYCYPRAIQMIGKYNLEEFTSQVYSLDDAQAAFDAQVSGKYVKIIIRCNDDIVDPAEK